MPTENEIFLVNQEMSLLEEAIEHLIVTTKNLNEQINCCNQHLDALLDLGEEINLVLPTNMHRQFVALMTAIAELKEKQLATV